MILENIFRERRLAIPKPISPAQFITQTGFVVIGACKLLVPIETVYDTDDDGSVLHTEKKSHEATESWNNKQRKPLAKKAKVVCFYQFKTMVNFDLEIFIWPKGAWSKISQVWLKFWARAFLTRRPARPSPSSI